MLLNSLFPGLPQVFLKVEGNTKILQKNWPRSIKNCGIYRILSIFPHCAAGSSPQLTTSWNKRYTTSAIAWEAAYPRRTLLAAAADAWRRPLRQTRRQAGASTRYSDCLIGRMSQAALPPSTFRDDDGGRNSALALNNDTHPPAHATQQRAVAYCDGISWCFGRPTATTPSASDIIIRIDFTSTTRRCSRWWGTARAASSRRRRAISTIGDCVLVLPPSRSLFTLLHTNVVKIFALVACKPHCKYLSNPA